MAGNIIPAIATTNAMTASICVMQAFKVMREELHKAKMVFLAPQGTERRMMSETVAHPNPDCTVCNVAQTTVEVDVGRATLNDLVEGLLCTELGYGDEFSVHSGNNILYDPEENINLPKTMTDLGLKNDSFVTVIDESPENARVNLVLHIVGKEFAQNTKPFHLEKRVDIPIAPPKKVDVDTAATNGITQLTINGVSNGTNGATNGSRKRTADDAGLEDELVKKKGKVAAKPNDDDVILVEDGAIVIDDD
jgi:ubiquitin-like 1-activating enzyme E1 B